jgi:hypothetical protein
MVSLSLVLVASYSHFLPGLPPAAKVGQAKNKQSSVPSASVRPVAPAANLLGELPVIRYDTSPEPKLLTLTSDGEWTNEELTRLDDVLEDWLEKESPERKALEKIPDESRPWLGCNPQKSAEDRKTIVIQAEHFKSTWCESLGRRLVKEYSFLWQMEVGEQPSADSPVEWDDTYVAVPRKTIILDDGTKATVEPFEIARYPVSFEQFFRFVSATSYVTTAEKANSQKTFLDPSGTGEPIAEPDRNLPVIIISYEDAIAYCKWAGVRLPTELEYLAAMILDDRIFPRGNADSAHRQDELFLSTQALRGNWLNFTSTADGDGRIVYRYGPVMLRYEGTALMDPQSRMTTRTDSFQDRIALRVCKGKSQRK